VANPITYKKRDDFNISVGFEVSTSAVHKAATDTNAMLQSLPPNLFRSIDYKTTSAMIGAIYCESLASNTEGIVNPIEKGHPDIVPISAQNCTEEQLRKYPNGLEIKCTVGNIRAGANLRAGQNRISDLTGITWQAHHREVDQLMGLIWDFLPVNSDFNFPTLTGIFYSDQLNVDDWGKISGTTGRNTKVTGMSSSGKEKMGNGWVLMLSQAEYLDKFMRFLKIRN
jgi:hypothetical protein